MKKVLFAFFALVFSLTCFAHPIEKKDVKHEGIVVEQTAHDLSVAQLSSDFIVFHLDYVGSELIYTRSNLFAPSVVRFGTKAVAHCGNRIIVARCRSPSFI